MGGPSEIEGYSIGPRPPAPVELDVDRLSLVAVAALLVTLSWRVAAPFWSSIVLGLLVAALTHPVHRRLRERIDRPRASAGLTVTGAVVVALLPLALVAWRVVAAVADIVDDLSVAAVVHEVERVMAWSHATFGYPEQVDTAAARDLLQEVVPSVQSNLAAWVPMALESTASILLGALITVAVAYYALVDGEAFLERLRRASPMRDRLEEDLLREARHTVDGVVLGLVATALLQAALGLLAFWVAGVPNPFFWAFAMAVLSFIQVVGALAVWGPVSVYLLATGSTVAGVGMILWGVLVISSVDNVVKPAAIGERSHLHPLLAFVGVLGGLAGFGIMGFLMGPLVLSLLAVVFETFAREDRGEEPGSDGDPAAG